MLLMGVTMPTTRGSAPRLTAQNHARCCHDAQLYFQYQSKKALSKASTADSAGRGIATGRTVRSGDRFGFPPCEAESDSGELRCAKRAVSAPPSLGDLAAFRLCFRWLLLCLEREGLTWF